MASFKQQCPSCEAMVLVKDADQIGKKIDCPRCKYRFVVEAPEEAAAGENDEVEIKDEAKGKPKSRETVTAKKPGPAPAAPTLRKKVGPRKSDDEAGAKPKKKKKKRSSGALVTIFGVAVSVCALGILAMGGYFMFLAPKDTGASLPTFTRPSQPTATTAPAKAGGLSLVEVTNLLPNDTQGILKFNVKDLLGGAVGRAAFQTPGAFNYEFVEQHFGLRAKEVDQVLVAQSFEKDWVFAVVRITPDPKAPLNLEELKKSLNLQPGPDSPYRGQEYFTMKPSGWLDNLGSLLSSTYPQLQLAPPLRIRSPALRVVDSHTLVIADLEPLKAFLDAKGQPKTMAAKEGAPPRNKKQPSKTFLTVNPELKALIEQMEGQNRSVLCFAWETAPVRKRMLAAADLLKPTGLADEKLVSLITELEAAGACLQMRDKMYLSFGLQGRDAGFAKLATEQLRWKAKAAGENGLFNTGQVRVELDGRPLVAPTPLPKGQVMPPPYVKIAVRTMPADRFLVLNAELQFNAESSSMALTNFLKPQMLILRGLTDMVGSPSRTGELAAALMALAKKGDGLPRGTFDRPIDANRLGRPFPPSERVGWMAELLPFLGHDQLKETIKFNESWKSPDNAVPGSVLVPAFLDARHPPNTWWVRLAYLGGHPYGATHFVGIAGLGLDAADYAADDKSVANKLGIMGYDRQTKLADIKDGVSNTILMLQVPPTYQRPWIAGGGATVMGVPETNSIRPFVGTFGKERGTYAIMADGSVRFLSEKISDEAFKALCTANGGEKVDVNKEAILKTQPALPK